MDVARRMLGLQPQSDPALNHQIEEVCRAKKNRVRQLADAGEAHQCLQAIHELSRFMNRFRNCDLQCYFDDEIHQIIAELNPLYPQVPPQSVLPERVRVAFLISYFNDLGGASVPHRFMLPNYSARGHHFENYILASNAGGVESKATHSEQYLREVIQPKEVVNVSGNLDYLERGKFIENWLRDRDIHFVVANGDPSILYALASRPAPFQAVLNQDCYTFALGQCAPFVDVSFLVTLDQVFNYAPMVSDAEERLRVVMLPLHEAGVAEETEPLPRETLGVPEDAVVSASSNMWKCFFGDTETLLEGIAGLLREHQNYYHLFIGTPRCEESLNAFLNRNPDLQGRLRYVGSFPEIYRFLKSIDFWVNSFPTSGGTDIECARIGKPSIELTANRNLNLHPREFLCSHECTVTNLHDFMALGRRFITEPSYRESLGAHLQQRVAREFDKSHLAGRRIYEFCLDEAERRQAAHPPPGLRLADSLDYEKRIALYSAYGESNWDGLERLRWLEEAIEADSLRPFAWVKMLELFLQTGEPADWVERMKNMPAALRQDARVLALLALCHRQAGQPDEAGKAVEALLQLPCADSVSLRVAARILLAAGRTDRALSAAKKFLPEAGPEDISGQLEALPPDVPPLFYNY
jgi:hypothetical protein